MCQSPCLSHLRDELITKAGLTPNRLAVNLVASRCFGQRLAPSRFSRDRKATSSPMCLDSSNPLALRKSERRQNQTPLDMLDLAASPCCHLRRLVRRAVIGNDDLDPIGSVSVATSGDINRVQQPGQIGGFIERRNHQRHFWNVVGGHSTFPS